ncbi:hypothetical protein E2320_021261, partial [Naja naja]
MERASEHHCPSANAVTFNSLCNEYENLLHKLGTTIGELLWLSNHHWGFFGFLLNLRRLQGMMQKLNYWQKTNPLLVCSLVGGFWIPWSIWGGGIRHACGHREITTPGENPKTVSSLSLDSPTLLHADKVVYSCNPLSLWANMAVALRFKASPKDGQYHTELEKDITTSLACAVLRKLLPVLPCAEYCATLLSPCRVIYRAKQVIGLSPWFFQGSSPSDCLAQEWAILEYSCGFKVEQRAQTMPLIRECNCVKEMNNKQSGEIFLLYPPYDRPAVTKLRQQPKLEHRSSDNDVDCGEAKSSTKCGGLSD